MSAFSPSFLSPELILDEAGSGRNGLNIFGPLELSFQRFQCYVTEPYLMNAHFWSFLDRAGSSWSMSKIFSKYTPLVENYSLEYEGICLSSLAKSVGQTDHT